MDELLEKAKDGDEDAFKEIFDTIKPQLYRISRARLDNEEDIYDAVNETVFEVYQNLRKLKHNEYFNTWIIRILINKCNKIYKLNNKHLKLIKKLTTKADNITYYDDSLNKLEDKLNFENLIKDLNYDERIVFILYFDLGYDTTQISKILKTNVNTIKSRLHRGKEKVLPLCKGGVEYDK